MQHLLDLKNELLKQFSKKTVSEDLKFDVGYYQGTKRIWIRNEADLKDFFQALQTKGATLWCDGVAHCKTSTRKHSRCATPDSSESDECETPARGKRKKKKTAYEQKLERIDDIVDKLREKHGSRFTSLQYRVWAETVNAGRHDGMESPPRGSFFRQSMKAAKAVSASPKRDSECPTNPPSTTCITPIKAAELKSTYIKQIKELYSLFEIGALSSEDFQQQKSAILVQMDGLHKPPNN